MTYVVRGVFCLLVLLASGFAAPDPAYAANLKVEWRVVQPFRFFRYQSDHKIHEWAFDEVTKAKVPTKELVSSMEKLLNSVAWWNRKPAGGSKTRLELFREMRRFEAEQLNRPYVEFDPRLGWASMLRDRNDGSPSKGTCWNSEKKTYRGCQSDIGQIKALDDYVSPQNHIVEIRVVSTKGPRFSGPCDFSIEGKVPAKTGFVLPPLFRGEEKTRFKAEKCENPVYLRAAFKNSYSIKVLVGGASRAELGAAIEVKDLLVVGIGDSFASGEGNPEFPAVLDTRSGVGPYIPVEGDTATNANDIIPTRKKNADGTIAKYTAARWLDDQCHRSIYSAQARAAIALALIGERHHAVTFVSYACSGAEITDGVFWPQDHRECLGHSDASTRLYQPQISGVVDALGPAASEIKKFSRSLSSTDRYSVDVIQQYINGGAVDRNDQPSLRRRLGYCSSWPNGFKITNPPHLKSAKLNRKIDLLMLSLGGNDIGFGPLVSKAVINSGFMNTELPLFTYRAIRMYQSAVGAITIREAERRMTFLNARFDMLQQAIRQKLEVENPKRVVMTLYPRLTRSDAAFCARGNKGMNVSTLFAIETLESRNTVTPKSADGVVLKLNASIRNIARDFEWTVADAHVERFTGHSFCDTDSNVGGVSKFAEQMDMPHKARNADSSAWKPFNPLTEFYPYESRKRWVRTFNDAYLLANYFKGTAAELPATNRDMGLYQAQRALGGPMHPTAQGHANMADAILLKAKDVLFENGIPRE